MKARFLFLLAVCFFFTFSFYSCEKDELVDWSEQDLLLLQEIDELTVEDYTADLAEFDVREELDKNLSAFVGKRPCFRFIFPIKFTIPNQVAPVVINSYKELREFLKKWKNNPTLSDVNARPNLIYPFKVKLFNGKILVINSAQQFAKLKKRCADLRPDFPKFRLCFDPVFPIYVSLPTQNAPVEVKNKKELYELFRKWKLNYPDADSKPAIVFPITVKTFDGSFLDINSMEELKKYLRECMKKLKG